MHIVYWSELTDLQLEDGSEVRALAPSSKQFLPSELSAAIKFTEHLRTLRRAGEPIAFVTISSEDPNCVGEMGVSDKLPEGYDWTKQDRAGKTRRR